MSLKDKFILASLCFLFGLCMAVLAYAQSGPPTEDSVKVNAPMAAFAESLGDDPRAHPCTQRRTMVLRAGKARLAGKSQAEAKAALGHLSTNPDADDVVGKVYAAPPARSLDDLMNWEFEDSKACEKRYGLVK